MKKKFLLLPILTVVFLVSGMSQSIEITPYIGYTFGGKTPTGYGEIKVSSSESYGGAFSIILPSSVFVQFEYFRQPTQAEYRDYWNSDYNEKSKTNIDWYHLGFFKQIPVNEKVNPFGGLSLGATNFRVESDLGNDQWSFSVALQGGLKIYLHDRIGLRLHARLLMPIQFGGFGFYAGSGGSGTSVSAGTYFLQGDVGAGLIIRLGN